MVALSVRGGCLWCESTLNGAFKWPRKGGGRRDQEEVKPRSCATTRLFLKYTVAKTEKGPASPQVLTARQDTNEGADFIAPPSCAFSTWGECPSAHLCLTSVSFHLFYCPLRIVTGQIGASSCFGRPMADKLPLNQQLLKEKQPE